MSVIATPSSGKISLKEEENQSPVHWVIENFVLWRLQRWKNNPRVNALIWKAILSVASMTIICSLFTLMICFIMRNFIGENQFFDFEKFAKDSPKVNLGSLFNFGVVFTGSVSVAYWNMSTMFNKKWNYCADLYNKIIAIPNSTIDHQQRALLRNALAIDLLVLDLWAHRSFSVLFETELMTAIECANSEEYAIIEKIRAQNGDFTENDAMKVLETRNHQLVDATFKKG